jgi:tetratricopeptide (TPR) repeat protein
MSEVDDLIAKGQKQLEEGKYKGALSAFKKVIAADPKNPDGYFGFAESAIGNQKLSLVEVAQHYKQAIELDPSNVIYYTSYADFCFQNGLLRQGEENFLKAIENDPENAPFYYNDLSYNYLNCGMKFMERVQQMGQDKYDVMKKAVEYALKAVEMEDGDAVEAAKSLIDNNEKLGQPNEDEGENKELASNPEASEILTILKKEENPFLYVEMGHIGFELGLAKAAEDNFLKAADLDPSNSRFYLNDFKVNYALFAKGNDVDKAECGQKCIYYLTKSLRIRPEDVVFVLTGENIE